MAKIVGATQGYSDTAGLATTWRTMFPRRVTLTQGEVGAHASKVTDGSRLRLGFGMVVVSGAVSVYSAHLVWSLIF